MNRKRVQAIQALQIVRAQSTIRGSIDPLVVDAQVDDPRRLAGEVNRWQSEADEAAEMAINQARANR